MGGVGGGGYDKSTNREARFEAGALFLTFGGKITRSGMMGD